jgi:hypothetical protein
MNKNKKYLSQFEKLYMNITKGDDINISIANKYIQKNKNNYDKYYKMLRNYIIRKNIDIERYDNINKTIILLDEKYDDIELLNDINLEDIKDDNKDIVYKFYKKLDTIYYILKNIKSKIRYNDEELLLIKKLLISNCVIDYCYFIHKKNDK